MYLKAEIFGWILIIFAAIFMISGFLATKIRAENISRAEKIPRNRLHGVILGAVCLFWCTYQARPLVSESLHVYLIPLAILCTWLGYMFLDYLFARSIGGFMILATHLILQDAFSNRAGIFGTDALFSFLTIFMGTVGIFICGKPYWLRDFIRKLARSEKLRYFICSIFMIYAAVYIMYGIIMLRGCK
jgi:hypothetical protein